MHRGAKNILQKVIEIYGNITDPKKVKEVLSGCLKCKGFRPRNYSGIKFHNAVDAGEKVAIDFLGPIQGHYIITGIDYFSRKGFAKALKTREANKVAEFVKEINSEIKIKTLVCDNAKEFISAELKKLSKSANMGIHFTTPYHHHSNGKVERFDRTIREGLARSEIKGPLKVKLANVLKVYNSVNHAGTEMKPNDAMNPVNWDALKRREYELGIKEYKKHAKPKKLYNFYLNQRVLVQQDATEDKQDQQYAQGGIVTKVMGNDTYEVVFKGKTKKRYAYLRGGNVMTNGSIVIFIIYLDKYPSIQCLIITPSKLK